MQIWDERLENVLAALRLVGVNRYSETICADLIALQGENRHAVELLDALPGPIEMKQEHLDMLLTPVRLKVKAAEISIATSGRVTLFAGSTGSGKTEATNLIVNREMVFGRQATIVQAPLNNSLDLQRSMLNAALARPLKRGSVVIVRDFLEYKYDVLAKVAKERDLTIVVEANSLPKPTEGYSSADMVSYVMRQPGTIESVSLIQGLQNVGLSDLSCVSILNRMREGEALLVTGHDEYQFVTFWPERIDFH